jgi:hypothetical protein
MAEQKTIPEPKQQLPNASASLILGILSIVSGCFSLGLVLGIIGLAISVKDKRMYDENPQAYTGYGNLNAGRILSIIGIVLGGLSIFISLIWGLIIGGALLTFLNEFTY